VSLKQWFFGSERPGGEGPPDGESRTNADSKKPREAADEHSKFLTPEQLGIKRPVDKTTGDEKTSVASAESASSKPEEKIMNSDKAPEDSKSPEDKPKTTNPTSGEKSPAGNAAVPDSSKSTPASATGDFEKPGDQSLPDARAEKSDEPKKPEASTDEKVAETPPAAESALPPLKAATWKTEPVKEAWCPPETAKVFPELDRCDYEDHVYIERIVSEDWRVIGGSRRGRKQAFDNRFREDAMAFGHTDSVTVLVVADGAGSSKYSRIGSHVAVQETVAEYIRLLKAADGDKLKSAGSRVKLLKEFVTTAVNAGRSKVVDIAEKSKLSPKEFRATLLTVVHYHGEGDEILLSNQVGDGAISLLLKDKTVKKFGDSDSGEFSGEVSCFLTDSEATEKAKIVNEFTAVDQLEAFFLCSDGIEDAFYPIEKKSLDIYRQWMNGVDEPLEHFKSQAKQPAVFDQEAAGWALAQWLEFEKRGENDDRTLLLMHRRPPSVQF
jgi:serine/threonine protein phosphatase PrpC